MAGCPFSHRRYPWRTRAVKHCRALERGWFPLSGATQLPVPDVIFRNFPFPHNKILHLVHMCNCVRLYFQIIRPRQALSNAYMFRQPLSGVIEREDAWQLCWWRTRSAPSLVNAGYLAICFSLIFLLTTVSTGSKDILKPNRSALHAEAPRLLKRFTIVRQHLESHSHDAKSHPCPPPKKKVYSRDLLVT